jgi:hypothetical protein
MSSGFLPRLLSYESGLCAGIALHFIYAGDTHMALFCAAGMFGLWVLGMIAADISRDRSR